MTFIINPYAYAGNFVSLHATDWGRTDSSHTSFTDTLSIGAVPTGGNRRFVFLMCGLTDGTAQSFEYASIPIAGTNGTPVTRSTAAKGASCICYREVSTGTTASCTTDYVGTPTINEAFMHAITVLTGPGGLTIRDSGSNYSTSSTNDITTTLTGMLDGHAILGVGAMFEGNSSFAVGATEAVDTGLGSTVFTTSYDFGKAQDASQAVGFNAQSTTAMGISAVAIEPA